MRQVRNRTGLWLFVRLQKEDSLKDSIIGGAGHGFRFLDPHDRGPFLECEDPGNAERHRSHEHAVFELFLSFVVFFAVHIKPFFPAGLPFRGNGCGTAGPRLREPSSNKFVSIIRPVVVKILGRNEAERFLSGLLMALNGILTMLPPDRRVRKRTDAGTYNYI